MTKPGLFLRRPWLAGVLVCVLLLVGMERGRALTAELPQAPLRIAGIVVPLCHAAGQDGTESPGRHDCCDDCALGAPLAVPEAPDWTSPLALPALARHDAAVAWAPMLARLRTPKLAQGPPRLT